MENNPSASRTDRKFTERNRRNQMKALFSKLNSVVPHQSSREANSLPDQIGEATKYIKNLQMKLEKMKEKKNNLLAIIERSKDVSMKRGVVMGLESPRFEIQQMGSALEVVLITGGLDSQFIFNETIRVLHEEGSDIVNASCTAVDNEFFHTLHCQVGDTANRAASTSEKLKKLLFHSCAF